MCVPYLFVNLIGLVRIPREPCLRLPQPRYPSPIHYRRKVRLRETSETYDHSDTLRSYAGTYIVRVIYLSHGLNPDENTVALHH